MNATFGVEEEYHLVEPSGELARRSAVAAAASSGDLEDCLHAGVRNQRIAYGSGESGRVMEQFLAERAARKQE